MADDLNAMAVIPHAPQHRYARRRDEYPGTHAHGASVI
jgi:hypothetical protein